MGFDLTDLISQPRDRTPTTDDLTSGGPRDAIAVSPLDAAVTDLYARLDDEIAARNPVCNNRGACCRFDTYGHRLYVTQVELDYFIGRQRPRGILPVTSGTCPYQVDGLCNAREHRPLGCRVFFCDENTQAWQPGVYEKYLGDLKRIGHEHGVSYRYSEWLTALREAGDEPRAEVT